MIENQTPETSKIKKFIVKPIKTICFVVFLYMVYLLGLAFFIICLYSVFKYGENYQTIVHNISHSKYEKNLVNFTPKANKNGDMFSGYMERLQRKIKSNWNPPRKKHSTKVIAMFKVLRNGQLVSVKLLKSSKDSGDNKAALEAIKKSAPFEHLPNKYKGNDIDIQFTFDYNVFQKTNK